ncbi:hypothetical protein V8E51_016709 [Hyaloscypha variabilis]
MADSDSLSSSETQVDWAPIKFNTWRRLIRDKSSITPEVFSHRLPGFGTETDPCLVEWLPDDVRNPMNLSQRWKWTLAWIGRFHLALHALGEHALRPHCRLVATRPRTC